MIQQGLALMIAGMVTVYFFLWLLVVSIQISERIIRWFSVRISTTNPELPSSEIIAAITTVLYGQQETKGVKK
jgi:Na+-transporting methylmalonyl-CoA/oxaloacetate decarboxylase gamma subunit